MTTVEKTALLPVPPEEAFALVTEPERLRRWLTVSARVDLRAGGTFRWTLTPVAVASGTVLEVDPGRRVVLGFAGETGEDAGLAGTLTVTLEPAAGGTLVRLVHDGVLAAEGHSVDEGWSHFVERLERAAATGDAGPDAWAAAPAPLDPLTCASATLAVLQHVLRGLDEADLARPTPCPDFTLGQLEAHLLGSLTSLTGLAGGVLAPSSAATLEARVADAGGQAVEAWRHRGLAGTVGAGDQELPAHLAASILSLELLVHGWDAACATGRVLPVSDEVATYVLGMAHRLITPALRASAGFGPAVDAPADAPALVRLVAFTGRRGADVALPGQLVGSTG